MTMTSEALATLYRDLRPHAFAVAYRMLAGPDDAPPSRAR
jgi:DNA-directed RNA polymerase specialized sigma24 family protein